MQEKKKTRFEDDGEEAKYKVYLKHVNMLNQMKSYLAQMHKGMSKEVVKKLVVSIKKMEQELVFYENNWHLFKNPNFDEESPDKIGVEDQQDEGKTGFAQSFIWFTFLNEFNYDMLREIRI